MKIVITLELDDDISSHDANDLAQAVLSDIDDYEPDEFTGDLRKYVKSHGYKVEHTNPSRFLEE